MKRYQCRTLLIEKKHGTNIQIFAPAPCSGYVYSWWEKCNKSSPWLMFTNMKDKKFLIVILIGFCCIIFIIWVVCTSLIILLTKKRWFNHNHYGLTSVAGASPSGSPSSGSPSSGSPPLGSPSSGSPFFKDLLRYPLAREGVWAPVGPAFLAHTKQKVSNIVDLTVLQLAFFMGYGSNKVVQWFLYSI